MEVLINFFALRPTFTFLGLKIVWYIYLLNTFFQTYIAVSGISQGTGAARNKFGSVAAKLYSPNPRIGCAARPRSARSGNGRYFNFHLAYFERY